MHELELWSVPIFEEPWDESVGAPTLTIPSSVAELPPSLNPDVLYGAALRELQPHIASFSPEVRLAVREGIAITEKFVGPLATKLADAVLEKVSNLLATEISEATAGLVSATVQGIASAVPILGTFVSAVMGVANIFLAQEAAIVEAAHSEAHAVLSRPLTGSGFGGVITPADIFAVDPSTIPPGGQDRARYPYMPSSPLGIALAAITEDSRDDAPGLPPDGSLPLPPGVAAPLIDVWGPQGTMKMEMVRDSNVHHSMKALDQLAKLYRTAASIDFVTGSIPLDRLIHVGIPAARRRSYQFLRRAIGSHNSDQGRALWPMYMGLLADDWNAGRMTHDYGVWLLTRVLGGPHARAYEGERNGIATNNYYGFTATDPNKDSDRHNAIPWGEADVIPLMGQIQTLVMQWNQAQKELKGAPAHKGLFGKQAKAAAEKRPTVRNGPQVPARHAITIEPVRSGVSAPVVIAAAGAAAYFLFLR